MTKIKIILGITLLLNFCYCKQNTAETIIPKDKTQKISSNDKKDSLNLVQILEKTLVIAKQHIDKENYQTELKTIAKNETDSITINLKISSFFVKTQRHLIVQTKTQSTIYEHIFLIKNKTFSPVLAHKELQIEYEKDSIIDVNNDGYKDFLILGYASSGCCLKNFVSVYLFQSDESEFSKIFEFINPTFDPNEKIIRGVSYGQRGETEMYKYKWNKKTIDTIEYISYEKDNDGLNTGKVIKSNKQNYKTANTKFIKLDAIPKEYLLIDGFDWFKGEN